MRSSEGTPLDSTTHRKRGSTLRKVGLPDPRPGTSMSTVNQQARAAPGQGGLWCPRPWAVHTTGLLCTLSLCRALFSSPSTCRSFLATPTQGRSVRTPRWHATPKPARKEGGSVSQAI